MKKALVAAFVLFLTISPLTSLGLGLSSVWDVKRNEKFLELVCGEKDEDCTTVCYGDRVCKYREGYCFNCIGGSLVLSHFFEGVGEIYVNSGEVVSSKEILGLIQSGNFVTITSQSEFNLVYRFNSRELKSRFQKLCHSMSSQPLVFAEVHPESKHIESFPFVQCDDAVYRLTSLWSGAKILVP